MKKWSRVGSGAVLFLVLCYLSFGKWHEPVHNGVSLRRWACRMIADPVGHRDKLHELGSRIVPYLAEEIRCRSKREHDIKFEIYCDFFSSLPFRIQSVLPVPQHQTEKVLNAIYLLGELGVLSRGAVPELITCLEESPLSCSAAITLGHIGPTASEAVPKIIDLLLRGEPQMATALSKIGVTSSSTVQALEEIMTLGSAWQSQEAARALMAIKNRRLVHHRQPALEVP